MDYPKGEGRCTECSVVFPTLEGTLHLEPESLSNGGLGMYLTQDDAGYWAGTCAECSPRDYDDYWGSWVTIADL